MGLDMYLYVETYISAKDINPSREWYQHRLQRDCVAYWRKANAIHAWFVKEAQNGVDECQFSEVFDADKLRELIDICKEIGTSKEKAAELLPTQAGFFFGSTDFDEYYFQYLKDTIEQLEQVLKDHPDGDFIYCSSW